jgi:hypothetical protein
MMAITMVGAITVIETRKGITICQYPLLPVIRGTNFRVRIARRTRIHIAVVINSGGHAH